MLFDQVTAHLQSLGYQHGDFSIYWLNFEHSCGIGLSWNNPNDGNINIEFYDGEAAHQGAPISVCTLDQAKAIVSNFHVVNEYLGTRLGQL